MSGDGSGKSRDEDCDGKTGTRLHMETGMAPYLLCGMLWSDILLGSIKQYPRNSP